MRHFGSLGLGGALGVPGVHRNPQLKVGKEPEWSGEALEMWSSVPLTFQFMETLKSFSSLSSVFCIFSAKNPGIREQGKSPKLPISQEFILQTPFPCVFGLTLTKSIEPLHSTKWILAVAGKTCSYHPGQLTLEFIFGFPQEEFWAPDSLCAPVILEYSDLFLLGCWELWVTLKVWLSPNFAHKGPKSLLSSRSKAGSLKVIIQCLVLVNYL